ncbi:MAG: hypothetical protein ACE5O2_01430 [Armatimonadota bacterium]
MLYPTETTCWKCGSIVRREAAQPPPSGPATQPPRPPGPTPPPPAAPTPGQYPPQAQPPAPGYPAPPPPPRYGVPPPGYGPGPQPPYVPYPMGNPEADKTATWALVCAIAGFCCCPLILGGVAIYLGTKAKNEGSTSGSATAAVVIGIIDVVLGVIGIIAQIVMRASGQSPFSFPTP